MKNNRSKPIRAIASALIFSTGIMLSCNIFAVKPIEIGDTGPGGGIVFHVTDDGQHGLEAAPSDQGITVAWDDDKVESIITNAVKEGIYGGSFNTDRTVSTLGAGDYAALVCANYGGGGYGDWYLPSKGELIEMHDKIGPAAAPPLENVGGFTEFIYWSSTEDDKWNAWIQTFGVVGGQLSGFKDGQFGVRAIRAF